MADNSDLDSADIANSKSIAKSVDDVAISALLNEIVLEVNCKFRGRSFEVNKSVIDTSATF